MARKQLLTLCTALILVGGFGTRLRPLVRAPCSLEQSEDFRMRSYTPSGSPACILLTDNMTDPHPAQTVGRVWQQAHDSAPG
jgi:hypothetical protein